MSDDTFNAVPLLANSYDLQDLQKTLEHAVGLKTPAARDAAIASAVTDGALLQDVLIGQEQPALPPDCVIGEVEDALGRMVTAPVAIVEDEPAPASKTKDTSAPVPADKDKA